MRSHEAATPHEPEAHAATRPHVETRESERAVERERAVAASDPYVDLKTAVRAQPIELDPRIDGPGDAAAEVKRLKPIAYDPKKYGAEASAALYKIAVLLYKPLHQDGEALRTVEFYERRFGNRGKESAAAFWLRVRILCARSIDEECRKAAYTYQHEIPNGAATGVAIRITNAQ